MYEGYLGGCSALRETKVERKAVMNGLGAQQPDFAVQPIAKISLQAKVNPAYVNREPYHAFRFFFTRDKQIYSLLSGCINIQC
jgi:hypothetical protein